jgi:hypothetical protein
MDTWDNLKDRGPTTYYSIFFRHAAEDTSNKPQRGSFSFLGSTTKMRIGAWLENIEADLSGHDNSRIAEIKHQYC